MLRFLLQRPIAVIMVFIAASLLSILSSQRLPVSLLPSFDIPEITIFVRYPNGSQEEIEQNILKPIRENMLTLSGLKTAESIAQNQTGKVSLRFEYGTNMNLTYIEVNERIDRINSIFPKDLQRPAVIKLNTSDLPVVRIQIVPTVQNDLLPVSELAVKVLKRRLEQLDGVGLVDINGTARSIIRISPDYGVLKSLQLTELDIAKTIENSNLDLGSLSVKDGNYRYFLKLASKIGSPGDIENLPIHLPGNAGAVLLKQVAAVYYEPEKPMGYHLFGEKQGIVITIHKQSEARLNEMISKVHATVDQFKKDYPLLEFHLTQDQSLLLNLSIQNLSQSLIWGGLFAFGVLFIFIRGWKEPLIMGIVLPLSLVLSFSILYIFDISLNIISLSGLAFGLGMLVDNSIVVIDNIMLKNREGNSVLESCIAGTQEVIVPLVSSALTNLSVFVPLIFLSGITGALFFDQAVAIAAILFVSILCTFILVPLLYLLLFENRDVVVRNDSRFFIKMKAAYTRSFQFIWQHKKISFILMSLLIPATAIIWLMLPVQSFPDIERTETIIDIEWNEPIDVTENKKRITELLRSHPSIVKQSEADVGYQQFLLTAENYSVQHAHIYLAFNSKSEKEKADVIFRNYLFTKFPLARIELMPAPNAFEQMFSTGKPLFEARFRDSKSKSQVNIDRSTDFLHAIESGLKIEKGKGFETESMIFIKIDFNKIKIYQINYEDIIWQLRISFGEYLITDVKNFGEITPVLFDQNLQDFEAVLSKIEVRSNNNISYPIKDFIAFEFQENYKNITADASGIFQSIELNKVEDHAKLTSDIMKVAKENSLMVDFTGEWFQAREDLNQLILILIISLLIMYFILTAEFESVLQPVMVLITLPIGFFGSLLFLLGTGGSLNIMSGIGLVVVLGILDNDTILKIDRINRLRKSLPLEQAIKQAGIQRLKPIVMNTCTNVLAIMPIVFSSGIGADLQRPVAVTAIGGLIVGTFIALYFVPLLYWFMSSKREEIRIQSDLRN